MVATKYTSQETRFNFNQASGKDSKCPPSWGKWKEADFAPSAPLFSVRSTSSSSSSSSSPCHKLSCQVDASIQVRNLKDRILETQGMLGTGSVYFVHNGVRLVDEEVLAFYKIGEGDKIFAVVEDSSSRRKRRTRAVDVPSPAKKETTAPFVTFPTVKKEKQDDDFSLKLPSPKKEHFEPFAATVRRSARRARPISFKEEEEEEEDDEMLGWQKEEEEEEEDMLDSWKKEEEEEEEEEEEDLMEMEEEEEEEEGKEEEEEEEVAVQRQTSTLPFWSSPPPTKTEKQPSLFDSSFELDSAFGCGSGSLVFPPTLGASSHHFSPSLSRPLSHSDLADLEYIYPALGV